MWQDSLPIPCLRSALESFHSARTCRLCDDTGFGLRLRLDSDTCHGASYERICIRYASDGASGRRRQRNHYTIPLLPGTPPFKTMHYMAESDVEDSDHSKIILKQENEGVISVEHLTYTYPFSKEPALKDVSMTVQKGDFIVVTGPNGAGKTTLLMSMAGAIPHYYGGTMQGMVYTERKGRHTAHDCRPCFFHRRHSCRLQSADRYFDCRGGNGIYAGKPWLPA